DLATVEVEPKTLASLPAKLVYKQRCVPIRQTETALTIATSDPFEISMLDELRLLTGSAIELVLADEDEIQKFISLHYGVGSDTLDEMSAGRAGAAAEQGTGGEADQEI